MKKFLIFVIIIALIVTGVVLFKMISEKTLNNTESGNNTSNDLAENEVNNAIDNADDDVNSEAPDNVELTDLFGKYYKQAENLLESMTLEEKVGQIFLVRFPDSGAENQIKEYAPGGYILFGKDFKNETKSSISKKLTNLQNTSKIKLIFGVDEEGGEVVRVSAYSAFRSSKFKSPQALYKNGGLQAILKDSTEKSNLLKELGLNMNLAPVADVALEKTSYIYKRTYGQGYEETANYISELIKRMNDDGMISVMKHFPGYGDNEDTHTGIAIDERSLDSLAVGDFLPFASGAKSGAPCVLVSHNIVKSIDDKFPASLSEGAHNILREQLDFSGVIMTDDLAMDAVKQYSENGEAAVQAVLAGNDMIITSDFEKQRQEVLNAINDGRISEDKIDLAVRRILAMKYCYGLI